MPVENNTELVTFRDWTLRVQPSRSSSPKLLVLIHGLTGDENSMWVFTPGLPPGYWMLAPRAPYAAETAGFSWRPTGAGPFGRPSLETFQPAADKLLLLIDEYAASIGIEAAQFDLIGFSQGAAMVNLLGMLHPRRVRKMGVLAGFVPSGLEGLAEQKPLEGKHVFVAHGLRDQMVPIEQARASIELLERAGAHVTFCEDEVGHKLSAGCLHALENYLKD